LKKLRVCHYYGSKCNTLEKHARKTKVIWDVTFGQEGRGILFEQEM
jgi:hypothetical protein